MFYLLSRDNRHPIIVSALGRLGIDVTTRDDVHLRAHTNTAHWNYAQRESRVIVTHDDDFLRRARQDVRHAGIAYCHPTKRTVSEIIRRLTNLSNEKTAEQMIGQVVYL